MLQTAECLLGRRRDSPKATQAQGTSRVRTQGRPSEASCPSSPAFLWRSPLHAGCRPTAGWVPASRENLGTLVTVPWGPEQRFAVSRAWSGDPHPTLRPKGPYVSLEFGSCRDPAPTLGHREQTHRAQCTRSRLLIPQKRTPCQLRRRTGSPRATFQPEAQLSQVLGTSALTPSSCRTEGRGAGGPAITAERNEDPLKVESQAGATFQGAEPAQSRSPTEGGWRC